MGWSAYFSSSYGCLCHVINILSLPFYLTHKGGGLTWHVGPRVWAWSLKLFFQCNIPFCLVLKVGTASLRLHTHSLAPASQQVPSVCWVQLLVSPSAAMWNWGKTISLLLAQGPQHGPGLPPLLKDCRCLSSGSSSLGSVSPEPRPYTGVH
jgi:hypothetical protein